MPCTDYRDDLTRNSRAQFRDRIVEVPAEIATYQERQLRRVLEVLNEIDTGRHVRPDEFNSVDKRGMVLTSALDAITNDVCSWFGKQKEHDIREMSLEAQIWWRDHQAMDKARTSAEEAVAMVAGYTTDEDDI